MKKSKIITPKSKPLILELHKINSRLYWSVKIEEYIIKTMKNFNGKSVTNEIEEQLDIFNSLHRILIDYNIIALHNIIEIQPMIKKFLDENGYSTLSESLKDSWTVIENEKTRIIKYRNLFIAHSRHNIVGLPDDTQLEKFDKDFKNTPKRISIAIRAGLFYLSPIIHTFDDEWEMGMLEYRLRGGEPDYQTDVLKNFIEISDKTDKLMEKTHKQLVKNGYMPFDIEGIF